MIMFGSDLVFYSHLFYRGFGLHKPHLLENSFSYNNRLCPLECMHCGLIKDMLAYHIFQYLLSDLIVIWRAWIFLSCQKSQIILGIAMFMTIGVQFHWALCNSKLQGCTITSMTLWILGTQLTELSLFIQKCPLFFNAFSMLIPHLAQSNLYEKQGSSWLNYFCFTLSWQQDGRCSHSVPVDCTSYWNKPHCNSCGGLQGVVRALSTIWKLDLQDRIYHTEIKIHLGNLNGRARVEKILILLLESGLIYCTIWVSINGNLCMSTFTLNGLDCVSRDPNQGLCDLTNLCLKCGCKRLYRLHTSIHCSELTNFVIHSLKAPRQSTL